MRKRELVGHLDVDAGIMMLGDPCYTLPDDATSREEAKDWSAFCSKLGNDYPTKTAPFEHAGAAFVVSTGFGDGTYPVFVEYYEDEYEPGKIDKRIKSVTVEFVSDEVDDDS